MRITKPDCERYEHAFGTIEGLAEVVRRLIQEVEVWGFERDFVAT